MIDGLKEAQKRIQVDCRDIEAQLARGDAKTYDQYRERVGRIAGLRHAQQILSEITRDFLSDADEYPFERA